MHLAHQLFPVSIDGYLGLPYCQASNERITPTQKNPICVCGRSGTLKLGGIYSVQKIGNCFGAASVFLLLYSTSLVSTVAICSCVCVDVCQSVC